MTSQTHCIVHVDVEMAWSGGEVQVFHLMEGLRERGHTSVLVCQPGSRCEQEGLDRGFEVKVVAMRNDVDLRAVRRLEKAFCEYDAAIVHLHTGRAAWLGGMAARRVGVRAIATRRMDRRVRRNPKTRLLYSHLVDAVAAISPSVAESLAAGGVARGKIRIIPSVVDPQDLVPNTPRADVRESQGVASDAMVLLVLASLIRRKGIDVLLDALKLLARGGVTPQVWVAGEGPERNRLEIQAASNGLSGSVQFLGFRQDVPDLLNACDVVVVPSRREGLGVCVLEAMAAGQPVVASAVGGIPFALRDDKEGLCVPSDDPAALADALGRVVRDPDLRRRLAAAGRRRIDARFRPDAMVAAYESLYDEVLCRSAIA